VLHIVGTVMLFVKATTLTIFQDAYANYWLRHKHHILHMLMDSNITVLCSLGLPDLDGK
jgi:hypothetical protein